ncbi:MAG: ATP synthase F1 subunit gamma [Deltaproteobacteria bacterium]|nr:ATP synthase F1 subunit gamma [Deltaproteobacteria bacterium]
MATLKTIRKRIISVKNTQKITKAMKMVAAAKLRRAQSALMQARPHRDLLRASVLRLVTQANAWNHPLFAMSETPKKAEILVMTSDRGLCGGFNGNLLRRVENYIRHDGKAYESLDRVTMGRKGREYYRAKNITLKEALNTFDEGFGFKEAEELAQKYLKAYQEGEFEVLYLAFNHFKSAISQEPVIQRILPLDLKPESTEASGAPIYWEGSPKEILEGILPRYLSTLFYLAVLESRASELGAKMSAMENATNNSKEMIHSLTLQYNRARQAAITTELMDIVNGAESLK